MKLKAKIRKKEENVNQLRREGFLPAVLYGPKTKNLLLKVWQKDFLPIFKEAQTSRFIDLVVEGEREELFPVLVKDVSCHYLSGQIIHIDFYQPDLKKTITTFVPLEFVGLSPAEKKGGILVKSLKKIEIESLPTNLPKSILVDISSLTDFDDKILVEDIKFPEGVKPLIDLKTIVVSVSEPAKEREEEKEAAAVPEEKAKEETSASQTNNE